MRRDRKEIDVLLNGVRRPRSRERERRQNEMERTMAVSLRESVQLVSDPRNLDASVEEVFQLMLGSTAGARPGPIVQEEESVTAVVGFGGLLSGACVFKSGSTRRP
jgi:hypothetical protein